MIDRPATTHIIIVKTTLYPNGDRNVELKWSQLIDGSTAALEQLKQGCTPIHLSHYMLATYSKRANNCASVEQGQQPADGWLNFCAYIVALWMGGRTTAFESGGLVLREGNLSHILAGKKQTNKISYDQ